MIRYIRQNDNFRCGPIAALNLMKWLGRSVSYTKDMKKYTKACKCDSDGTEDDNLISALSRLSKGEYTVSNTKTFRSLSTIENHIDDDGAIILTHRAWDEPDHDFFHFSLLVPDNEYFGYVTWINSFALDHPHTDWKITPTAMSITFNRFERLVMAKQRIGDKLYGIMITKNE
jgi:hypothetical protein